MRRALYVTPLQDPSGSHTARNMSKM